MPTKQELEEQLTKLQAQLEAAEGELRATKTELAKQEQANQESDEYWQGRLERVTGQKDEANEELRSQLNSLEIEAELRCCREKERLRLTLREAHE